MTLRTSAPAAASDDPRVMTVVLPTRGSEPGGRVARARRDLGLWLRHSQTARGVGFLLLGLAACLFGVWKPYTVPPSAYAPAVLLAALYLRPSWMTSVAVTFTIELVVLTLATTLRLPWTWSSYGALVANVLVIVMAFAANVSRSRVGVEGHGGESMFVDLRDRLKAFGELPELPAGWHAESAVESAYGQSFSGDFVVATNARDGQQLEVTVVDVSGKGVQAGTRSLLLSGALGGLLGETRPDRFLGAANSYLVGQHWDEGFATAVHVSVDLATGRYDVGTAGHPSAVQFHCGSGRWTELDETSGPVLGVLEAAVYHRTQGSLQRGDALLLYTDGVIETRDRDLSAGVDRMLGTAERLLTKGFRGGASRLCAAAGAGESDDRAVVMIWRD
ncbi:MAG: serine/threonine-protein phosphatase [Actinomycetota bacterium]|nr:serine/threonine-protein phosphatase [Actinomycetota bacterium]